MSLPRVITDHSELSDLDFASSNHTGFASDIALNTHVSNVLNPHAVTAVQIGALTQPQANLLYAPLNAPATNSLLDGLTALYTAFAGGNWAGIVGPTITNNAGVTSGSGQFSGTAAEFNGSTQWFSASDADAFHMGDHDFTITCTFNIAAAPGVQGLISHLHRLYVFNDNKVYFELSGSGPLVTTLALTRNAWHTVVAWRDTITKTINIQADGGAIVSVSDANLQVSLVSTLFYIGRYPSPALPTSGKIQEVGIWKRTLTSAERTTLFTGTSYPWGGPTLAPPTTTITLLPSDYQNNAYTNYDTDHYQTNAYAVAAYTTTAERIEVVVLDEISGSFNTFAPLAVHVNGVLKSILRPRGVGTSRLVASLGVGNKTVEITGGLQTTLGGVTVEGVWPQSVTFPGTDAKNFHSPERALLLVYGDSIAVGANAATPVQNGWGALIRDTAPMDVAFDAWGYRALYDDTNTAVLRAAFVAKIIALRPSSVWMAIGTNDYGLNKWAAAAFGTAYAAVLDDIHTALPLTTIYCQTPLVRGVETVNGNGSTMGDYRTQITTATTARPGWTVLVDGTTILTLSDLDGDQVHPIASGHVKYARFVRTALGY